MTKQRHEGMIPLKVQDEFLELSQEEQKKAVTSFLKENIIKPSKPITDKIREPVDEVEEVEERPTRTHLATAHESVSQIEKDISRKGRVIHQAKPGKGHHGGTVNIGGRMIRN